MTLRLINHLCPAHTTAALDRWPIAGDLSALFDACDDCLSTASRLHPEGSYTIRSLPHLSLRTYDYVTSLHEAAHAVLGLHAGMRLNFVEVEPRTDAVQDGFGGRVNWADYTVPLDQWAAMVWAGQRAQTRWLIEADLVTAANRVDVSNLGWDDTRRVLEAAAEHRAPEWVGWELCADLLDRWWPSVVRVAEVLASRHRLSGDEVADLAGMAVRA